ncbi:type VI secretion-associated protein [Serratia sp. TEL]|jgi:type VI secretion system protein VasD|nr:type VI secretion-associated protein [Serratia sp. TEL]
MVKTLRGIATGGLLAVGMLGGCSWFSHDEAADAGRRLRFIEVEVTANDNVNPNAAGEAQPVKVCVIETNRSGWMPEGIGDGAPCRETAPSEGALSRHQSILQPRETLRYRFEVPAGQERWVVVGAEFQQISGVLPLAEQKSPAQADSQMKVMVGMTSLSIVTNDKMDE